MLYQSVGKASFDGIDVGLRQNYSKGLGKENQDRCSELFEYQAAVVWSERSSFGITYFPSGGISFKGRGHAAEGRNRYRSGARRYSSPTA